METMNIDGIEEIYNSWLNGQMKQMVNQIKEYEYSTGDSFWEGLDGYMREWNPILKYRTLFEIVSYYTKFGGQ
jgi:hypothetical protein